MQCVVEHSIFHNWFIDTHLVSDWISEESHKFVAWLEFSFYLYKNHNIKMSLGQSKWKLLPEPFCEPFLFLRAFCRISFMVTFKLSTGISEKPWAAFLYEREYCPSNTAIVKYLNLSSPFSKPYWQQVQSSRVHGRFQRGDPSSREECANYTSCHSRLVERYPIFWPRCHFTCRLALKWIMYCQWVLHVVLTNIINASAFSILGSKHLQAVITPVRPPATKEALHNLLAWLKPVWNLLYS